MGITLRILLLTLVCGGALSICDADEAPKVPLANDQRLVWQADYAAAKDLARAGKKMVFICFHDPARDDAFAKFRDELFIDSDIASRLSAGWVMLSLPVDARVRKDDQDLVLLEHDAFREMHNKPGLAILDYRDESLPHYGYVVSVLPIGKEGAKYRAVSQVNDDVKWVIPRDEVLAILDLPPGSLTQRTLIFAVRTHPDEPASAAGELHPLLAQEAESHSAYQARIRVQGHHSWDQRFHAINAKLLDGLVATEVCAESWSGQTLLEAARECVHSWRQSSGHWNSVRAKNRAFGYDMKRGSNGTWYATGIFGRSR